MGRMKDVAFSCWEDSQDDIRFGTGTTDWEAVGKRHNISADQAQRLALIWDDLEYAIANPIELPTEVQLTFTWRTDDA